MWRNSGWVAWINTYVCIDYLWKMKPSVCIDYSWKMKPSVCIDFFWKMTPIGFKFLHSLHKYTSFSHMLSTQTLIQKINTLFSWKMGFSFFGKMTPIGFKLFISLDKYMSFSQMLIQNINTSFSWKWRLFLQWILGRFQVYFSG